MKERLYLQSGPLVSKGLLEPHTKAGIDDPHYLNVMALGTHLPTRRHTAQNGTQYATRCTPDIDYFKTKFCSDSAERHS